MLSNLKLFAAIFKALGNLNVSIIVVELSLLFLRFP